MRGEKKLRAQIQAKKAVKQKNSQSMQHTQGHKKIKKQEMNRNSKMPESQNAQKRVLGSRSCEAA